MNPKPVSQVMMAFPADVREYLPPEDQIPKQYWEHDDSWTQKLFSDWFFGSAKDMKFYPKPGIDAEMAFRHIRAVMGSYQPQHEHKEAGCRFLIDSWFEKVEWTHERLGPR